MMLDKTTIDDLLKEFTLTCNKCGSTEVGLHFEEGHQLSEYTMDLDSLTVLCRACGHSFVDFL